MAITSEFALEQAILCESDGNYIHAEQWLEVAAVVEKPLSIGCPVCGYDGSRDGWECPRCGTI